MYIHDVFSSFIFSCLHTPLRSHCHIWLMTRCAIAFKAEAAALAAQPTTVDVAATPAPGVDDQMGGERRAEGKWRVTMTWVTLGYIFL